MSYIPPQARLVAYQPFTNDATLGNPRIEVGHTGNAIWGDANCYWHNGTTFANNVD